MVTAFRTDRGTLNRATRTDEGYIEDEAVVTRTGVFLYQNVDGTVRRELRHPDDVFAADSLESLSMLPVTIDHPIEGVDSANAKAVAVGFTGEHPRVDGRLVKAKIRITDAEAVQAIENGRRELSMGYRTDLIEEAGTYGGEEYTHRQTAIRYNHLAVVDKARAGSVARLNLDGAAVQIDEETHMPDQLEKVLVSGIRYDAAPEVAAELAKLRKDHDETQAKLADATKRADTLEGERDALADKLKAAEAVDHADAIREAVQNRVALIAKATGIVADDLKLDAMTDREIQEAVIKQDAKDLDLSGKSDDYVQARFDAAIESHANRKDATTKQRQTGNPPVDPTKTDTRHDSEAARERFLARLHNQDAKEA